MSTPEQTPAPEQWMLEAAMAIRAGLGGGFYWEKRHEDTAAIIIARHAPTAPDLAKVRAVVEAEIACADELTCKQSRIVCDRILTALAPFLSAPALTADTEFVFQTIKNLRSWVKDMTDEMEPVGAPGDPCCVNMGRAYVEMADLALAHLAAQQSGDGRKEASP